MMTWRGIPDSVLKNQRNIDAYVVEEPDASSTYALIVPRGGPAAVTNMSTVLISHKSVVHNHFYMQVRVTWTSFMVGAHILCALCTVSATAHSTLNRRPCPAALAVPTALGY
jgi:hypothetical protein